MQMLIYIWKAKLFAVWLLFFFAATPSYTQTKFYRISIQLTVNSREFVRSSKPTATITVENRSGSTFFMRELAEFSLKLESSNIFNDNCGFNECFTALVGRTESIENGGSLSFSVKLSDLYWHNSISSSLNLRYPKNLFTDVPAGSYKLYARIGIRNGADPKTGFPINFQIVSDPITTIWISTRK